MSHQNQNAEEYLEKRVRGIIEPMVSQIIVDQPKEPMLYMIEWLQNLQGKKLHGHQNMEKTELQNLRKEMKKYREKYAKQDEEMKVDTDSEGSDDEEKDEVDKIIEIKKQAIQSRGQRASVSAEAYGKFNKKEDFKPKVIPKTDEQKNRILNRVMQSFLFNSLEDKDVHTVIDAMEERKFKAGDYIIKQGENGDVLFLIEEGVLDCYKTFVNQLVNLEKRRWREIPEDLQPRRSFWRACSII